MIQGVTKSGFNYVLEENRLNNFELLDIFSQVDDNPLLFPKCLTMLLGDEQKEKLYEHVRNEEGIVPTDMMIKELEDIFSSNKQIKN